MTEESKPPKKTAKVSPREMAITGAVVGVTSVALAFIAHHIGYPLSELQKEMMIGGGVASLLGGTVAARFWPTKGDA